MERVIYDAVIDAEGCFSSEFRNYVRDQKLICHYLHNISPFLRPFHRWLFSHDPQADGVDSTNYHLTKEFVMIFESILDYYVECMVQFWKAEELTGVDNLGGKRFLLTTCNQPFMYYSTSKQNQIYSYRMGIDNIVTGDEGGGGVIGRAYRNKRLEFTPNISYYSSEEYPHRDSALCCGIRSSFSMPIFDSSGRLVGVLEALFQLSKNLFVQQIQYRYQEIIVFLQHVISKLQQKESSFLRYLDPCKDFCGQSDLEAKSLDVVVSEIRAVIEVFRRNGVLVCAQTWILCYHCDFLSPLYHRLEAAWSGIKEYYVEWVDACKVHVKKGEGVVGKAATSSQNLVYCQDVSRLSIIQNPMAHFAGDSNLTSCFAVCLKSDLTQSKIYVLEFFLDPRKVNTGDLKATLVPILEAMKLNFRTFKLASGKEIGDYLFVQVIDAHSPDQMVPLRDMGLDLTLAIGMNSIESTSMTEDTFETDDPMTEDTSMEETSLYSASTVQSECRFTIMVNYSGGMFTFRLSSTSDILELDQQVSHRFNLEDKNYIFKYLDEDGDWILLTCTVDLHLYIKSAMQQGKHALMMTIELV